MVGVGTLLGKVVLGKFPYWGEPRATEHEVGELKPSHFSGWALGSGVETKGLEFLLWFPFLSFFQGENEEQAT